MKAQGKYDITELRQQLESKQTALQDAYRAQIQELGQSLLSLLEKKEQELGLEALTQPAAERGIELYRETVNARYADTGECPTLIKKLDLVYALHPQGPVLIVNESTEATGCYRGGYYGHKTSRKMEGRLNLDEFAKRLDQKQLPEVYEKLIAVVKEKGME